MIKKKRNLLGCLLLGVAALVFVLFSKGGLVRRSGIDFAYYPGKIWVVKEWRGEHGDYGESYKDKISFRITYFDEHIIRGKIATGGIAEPDFYTTSYEKNDYIGDFEGRLKDDVATCQFADEAGNRGWLVIIFHGGGVVEASFDYEQWASGTEDIADGKWFFRPYTLQDVIDCADVRSYFPVAGTFTDVGGMWQDANFVYAEIAGEKKRMDSYLEDKSGNILYHFALPYHKSSQGLYAKLVDVNQDDRMDLEITYEVGDNYTYGKQRVKHTLVQLEDGTFYDYDLEDDIANDEEGRRLTVQGSFETIASGDGEIVMQVPEWSGFSGMEPEKVLGGEMLVATMEDGNETFQIAYSLIKCWDIEKAPSVIYDDVFTGYYSRMGAIRTMSVDGVEVYYMPCYYEPSILVKERCYIIWADFGCGYVLRTQLKQEFYADLDADIITDEPMKPFAIEHMIEQLYANVKMWGAEGEEIPINPVLPDKERRGRSGFDCYSRFGIPVYYDKDDYRNQTNCGELIGGLADKMQAGTIEDYLQEGEGGARRLTTAEKNEYIRREADGRMEIIDVDAYYEGAFLDREWELIEQPDGRRDVLLLSERNDGGYQYFYFTCREDGNRQFRTPKARRTVAPTKEHYFLPYQGMYYLCLPKRDADGKIKGVALYDFDSRSEIGSMVYITDKRVVVSPYIRDSGWGEITPWYLNDMEVECLSIHGEWIAVEYLGESVSCRVTDETRQEFAVEQKITENLRGIYLDGKRLVRIVSNNKQGSASSYGYYYTSLENLYEVYGQPKDLALEAPVCCVNVITYDNGTKEYTDMDILTDANGKSIMCVQGRFFLLKKKDGPDMGIRDLEL